MFIEIHVDEKVASDSETVARLTDVCPVDIFAQADDGMLDIVEENVDECVLCRLCLEVAPEGTIEVRRLYDGGKSL